MSITNGLGPGDVSGTLMDTDYQKTFPGKDTTEER